MENRPPGPEDADNSTSTKSNKAEHVAAWLRRQRDDERHILFANKAEKDDGEEDDKKDSSQKKAHHLRLGSLTVQGGDAKAEPKVESDENSLQSGKSEKIGDEHEHTVELIEDQPTGDMVELPRETDLTADEAVSEATNLEADFEQWEQELAAGGLEAGSAEMQMTEGEDDDTEDDQVHIPRQRTTSSAATHHQPRRHSSTTRTSTNTGSSTTASMRYLVGSPPPVAAAGGGGGVVPPMPPVGGIPGGPHNPNGPFGPNGPNAHNVFNSPNTLVPPVNPNVLTSTNPNKINDHEHKHGHPRLAAAMLVGLLIERSFRRSADQRIEKESRDRTDKLFEQIKRNQTAQEQARQKMEAQQLELAAEQARQRRALEYARPATNNVERPIAPGRAERAAILNSRVEATQSMVDAEFRQDVEQVTLKTAEAEARSQAKVVMERIAVASELDEPVERVFERRQEVKDEPSNPAGAAGGATSIGSVLAKNGTSHQQSYGSHAGQGGQMGDHSHGNDPHAIDYRAAAIRGVGAGLAVIVLALMAYLLM